MKERIPLMINKAERSLEAARTLHKSGMYDFAVSRAYYTMFYCAEAILLTKGISVSKHSALIALLGKEFVKTGEVPYRFFTYITLAFEVRQVGDYSVMNDIPEETSLQQIKHAEEFLEFTRQYLSSKGFLEE
ncbi:HEPN domain-containing protein [Thermococcus thioreducens]|uniref:HEPN domain-containing protein n=1 Tax=Thermococcus thioreducens TaxID=277988 RepID=A0A0Q2XNI7_9EURY|nr:HEPN domain-containing protein [Thermococcus thioreducens]ASJ11946.1 HEPN domain-containing protein [Thermococcus thioreducens]KQH82828.1 hypothetical protein AMR53_04410 [Thermococcus thioreducens]SEW11159.1 Uncharacterized protein, contains HEPN domain, UPF0332 family [Thermococcus thioreducens]